MLYAMTGTEAPSRWYALIPGLLSPTQECQFIAEVEAGHIDFVLVSNRSTFEYGFPYFGIDYCTDLYKWIESHYDRIGEFGRFSRRLGAPFGVLVYQRRGEPVAHLAEGTSPSQP
jgi:hypothetical protein